MGVGRVGLSREIYNSQLRLFGFGLGGFGGWGVALGHPGRNPGLGGLVGLVVETDFGALGYPGFYRVPGPAGLWLGGYRPGRGLYAFGGVFGV